MKILGLYKEFWSEKAGVSERSVREDVRGAPSAEAEKVHAYLRDGYVLLATMGATQDVLGSDESILGGDSLYTDGTWVWRGDLRFYVRRYHLALPEEFLDSVRESAYVVPPVPDDRLVELTYAIQEIV
ncbi:hypothetical protein [Streptomyces sp. GSL17-111]|uniref:hypothetical protein n=1 Tax=Streptomyces sp. GSL17-111 TaxID=3121596 RepID=UPI0030F4273D